MAKCDQAYNHVWTGLTGRGRCDWAWLGVAIIGSDVHGLESWDGWGPMPGQVSGAQLVQFKSFSAHSPLRLRLHLGLDPSH